MKNKYSSFRKSKISTLKSFSKNKPTIQIAFGRRSSIYPRRQSNQGAKQKLAESENVKLLLLRNTSIHMTTTMENHVFSQFFFFLFFLFLNFVHIESRFLSHVSLLWQHQKGWGWMGAFMPLPSRHPLMLLGHHCPQKVQHWRARQRPPPLRAF